MQVKGIKRQIGWLYVFPAILILLTFLIIPFLMSFSYSFTNYNILTPWAKQYVGFTITLILLKILSFYKV